MSFEQIRRIYRTFCQEVRSMLLRIRSHRTESQKRYAPVRDEITRFELRWVWLVRFTSLVYFPYDRFPDIPKQTLIAETVSRRLLLLQEASHRSGLSRSGM